MNNKVVARYADGRLVKGSTSDFVPTKASFHILEIGSAAGSKPAVVHLKDLKAIFFVKDFTGRTEHQAVNLFDADRPAHGRKIKVVFTDGETIVGTTQGYQPGRPGFFMIPADADGNNERCYVVAAATKEITLL